MRIAPSITSGDIGRLAEMTQMATAGGADRIHLDIEDGVFLPTFTVGPAAVAAVRAHTDLPLEVHLQTVEPERYLGPVLDGGADIVLFHPESTRFPWRIIREIRARGGRPGLALLLATPVSALGGFVAEVEQVTIMTADPPPASHFHAHALQKLAALQQLAALGDAHPALEVDGGITAETLPAAARAGATLAVAGRAVFGGGDKSVAHSIKELQSYS